MKTKFPMIILLTIAAAALLVFAAVTLDSQKDQIQVKEQVLYGDKSSIEGTELIQEYHYSYRETMRWKTSFAVGAEDQSQTAFTKLSKISYPNPPFAELSMDYFTYTDDDPSSLPLYIKEEDLKKVIQDAAKKVPAGQSAEVYLPAKDYLKTLFFRLNADYPDIHIAETEETQKLIADYFRMPVPDEGSLYVQIEKDSDGTVLYHHVQFYVGTNECSLVTKEGIYLAFNSIYVNTDYGESIEIPLAEGSVTPGLYHIPLNETKEANVVEIDAQNIKKIHSVSVEASIQGLNQSGDGKHLLLTTLEDEKLWLTVIEKDSGKTIQRLFLDRIAMGKDLIISESGEQSEEDVIPYLEYAVVQDDLLLLNLSDGNFYLLEGKDGNYTLKLKNNFKDRDFLPQYWYEHMAMDYDGSRLAIFRDDPADCQTVLTIFDEDGLNFCATYRLSINATPERGTLIQYNSDTPLTVRLPKV